MLAHLTQQKLSRSISSFRGESISRAKRERESRGDETPDVFRDQLERSVAVGFDYAESAKSEERSKYCGSGGESGGESGGKSGGESGGKSGGLLMVAARRRSMMEKARPEAKERWGGREGGRKRDG